MRISQLDTGRSWAVEGSGAHTLFRFIASGAGVQSGPGKRGHDFCFVLCGALLLRLSHGVQQWIRRSIGPGRMLLYRMRRQQRCPRILFFRFAVIRHRD